MRAIYNVFTSMRLFTGLSIGEKVLGKLAHVLEKLRPAAALNWAAVTNLHITAKFIGEWPEARLDELQAELARVEPAGEFDVTIVRFGFFPNPHHPHTLFAGVQAGPGLGGLATGIDEALARIGCEREARPYKPHLTLARIKHQDIRALREHIASMNDFDFGTFHATAFHLYVSQPGPRGSVYSVLSSYPLAKAA